MTQHVVSFSGGKDSTALLLLMLEKGMPVDRVVNVDTTKEFPEIYEHIENVKRYISPVQIETIKIDYDYWFSEHVKTKGKMIGTRGYGWPDFRNRWCTALKRLAFQRCVYGTGQSESRKRGRGKRIVTDVIEYHGIAFDEMERTKKNADGRDIRYPLIDWQMREVDALEYCYSKGFDFGGLYKYFKRVSCYCCPLSSMSELRYTFLKHRDLWENMLNMDKKSFRTFRSNCSLDQLTELFSGQRMLFDE